MSASPHPGAGPGADLGPPLHSAVLSWYAASARDLPWRAPSATPWAVLISEVMLQQTPVARVLPVWSAWLDRWPSPGALAEAGAGEAVRAWGRLGYPRRALRLHAAAVGMVSDHDGEVPADLAALLALPGIGDYTAAAVASFAYRQRHVVLDTNVRRVLARVLSGVAQPAPAITRDERDLAAALLPDDPEEAATWAVAVMELGALVCTAGAPRCADCPIADRCRWRQADYPAYAGPPRRSQRYDGTDRQCRGCLLAVLRADPLPIPDDRLAAAWPVPAQRSRCLAALEADGLVVQAPGRRWALPD